MKKNILILCIIIILSTSLLLSSCIVEVINKNNGNGGTTTTTSGGGTTTTTSGGGTTTTTLALTFGLTASAASTYTVGWKGAVDSSGNYYQTILGGFNDDTTGTINIGSLPAITDNHNNSIEQIAVLVKYNAAGVPQWTKSAKTYTDGSRFSDVKTDTTGDVYVAGYLVSDNTFDMGDFTVKPPADNINLLIVKYGSDGTYKWHKTLESVSSNGGGISPLSLYIDNSSGCLYVCGDISAYNPDPSIVYNFGNGVTITGSAATVAMRQGFVAKYSLNGTCLAANVIDHPVTGQESGYKALEIDATGDIICTGYVWPSGFSGTFEFGGSVTATCNFKTGFGWQYYDLVVTKYDSDLNPIWAKIPQAIAPKDGSCSLIGRSVHVNSIGDIVVMGSYANNIGNTIDFGNSITVSNSTDSSFVVVYSNSGTAIRVKTTTVLYSDFALDSNNYLYLIGGESGTRYLLTCSPSLNTVGTFWYGFGPNMDYITLDQTNKKIQVSGTGSDNDTRTIGSISITPRSHDGGQAFVYLRFDM